MAFVRSMFLINVDNVFSLLVLFPSGRAVVEFYVLSFQKLP